MAKVQPYWVWGCPYCGSARTTMSCCGESSDHFCWLGLDGENVHQESEPDDPRDELDLPQSAEEHAIDEGCRRGHEAREDWNE